MSDNMSELFPFTDDEKPIRTLMKTATRSATIKALSMFADADAAATLNMLQAGKLYHQLLSKPLPDLIAFLKDYCEQTGINMPEVPEGGKRGRPTSSGRNLLAAAVYGRYPLLLEKNGMHDSRAGKRITACLRKYQKSAGLLKAPRKSKWPKDVPHSARGVLAALIEAATALKVIPKFKAICDTAFGSKAVKSLQKLLSPPEKQGVA